jgi:hypothetical protein
MTNQPQYPNRPPFEGGPQFQPPAPKKKRTGRTVAIVGGSIFGGLLALGILGSFLPDNTVQTADAPLPNVVSTTADTGPSPDPVVTPTNKPSPKPTVAPKPVAPKTTQPKPTKTTPAMTASQEQAIGTAEDYLQGQSFSRKGLIEQLKYEGFSKADATYAVTHITVSWNEQAAKTAENYLDGQHFSRSGLIEQLEFEGFTHAQAVYGVNKAGL